MILGVSMIIEGRQINLPSPNRHCDIIKYAVETLKLSTRGSYGENQGFYINDGIYLNRKEAYSYAQENGLLPVNPVHKNKLFSEDLW